MLTTVNLSARLLSTESPMAVGLAFRHAHDSTLIAHLPPTENPMTAELAFRHANDGKSQSTLTSYSKSNDGGVSLPACQQRYVHLSVHLLSTESPMTVELAFRHANNGTSQCQLTA